MRRSARLALLGWLLAVAVGSAARAALPAHGEPLPGMARIPGGDYLPFYRTLGTAPVAVAPFWLDVLPVTNAEFLAFVSEHPAWRRSRVSALFAEPSYLSHWGGDEALGAADPRAPVTFVSWFAASAYCRSLEKRLPSEAEWELTAAPPEEPPAVRAETLRRILAFYGRPRGVLPAVGSTPPNAFGVRDLHGVQWEWIEDWNASLPASEGRSSGTRASDAYCGGAALGAGDPSDYATFMRFAFRSSLEGRHALHHLGFRCAKDAP